jgi:hypothetical protein
MINWIARHRIQVVTIYIRSRIHWVLLIISNSYSAKFTIERWSIGETYPMVYGYNRDTLQNAIVSWRKRRRRSWCVHHGCTGCCRRGCCLVFPIQNSGLHPKQNVHPNYMCRIYWYLLYVSLFQLVINQYNFQFNKQTNLRQTPGPMHPGISQPSTKRKCI